MRRFDKLKNITKLNKMLSEGFVGPGTPLSQEFAELAKQYGIRTISTSNSPITSEDVLALMDRNNYNHDLLTWMEQSQAEGGIGELEDNEITSKVMIGSEVFLIPNAPTGNEGEFFAAYEQQIKPQLGGVTEGDVNEISGETFKSAVNKTRDKQQYPRTSRLGELFLHKINGIEICGGQVEEATVLNDRDTMRAILTIRGERGEFVNVYDVTNDEWHIRTGPMDRRSARTLSQISQKFNKDTRYVNFQDNFIIKGVHTESVNKSLNVLNEASKTMFEKLCGVKVIKESNDSSESKHKYDEVDAVMAKLGIALTTTATSTHGVSVDGNVRVFRPSQEEAEMIAQKLGSILKDKSIDVVDLL